MKNKYQIVFIDIDWTILDHSIHDWDYESLEAIKKVQELGGYRFVKFNHA